MREIPSRIGSGGFVFCPFAVKLLENMDLAYAHVNWVQKRPQFFWLNAKLKLEKNGGLISLITGARRTCALAWHLMTAPSH